MWKVDNDEENNERQRTFFSDIKPFKFGSGELIIKATDPIRAVTTKHAKNISIKCTCQNSDTYTPPLEV